MAILLAAGLFCLMALVVGAFGYYYYVKPSKMIDQLTNKPSGGSRPVVNERGVVPGFSLLRLLAPIGNILPISAQDLSLQQRQLLAAGIRGKSAVQVLYGAKMVLTVALLIAALILRGHFENPLLHLIVPIAACGAGYALPSFILGQLIKRRNDQIRMALPDVLDLLVVCTEAGCGLDQAIVNVSRELKKVHPSVSEELTIVNMEIMAGKSRADALRNFARRCGEEELRKLVAVLIQTDRFGTSVADALRTQADYLRIRRRQEAEERAGKVGVKLVFPIFFFCLPSLLVVTAGPGMLELIRNLGSMNPK